MEICVPFGGQACQSLRKADFEKYPIPLPPGGCEESEAELSLLFKDTEEAVKYGLHLGDVEDRLAQKPEHACALEKVRKIIACINDQADFKSLTFPE